MSKRRTAGFTLLLMGVVILISNLSKPRIGALHGADIVGFLAFGACFGIGFVGLLARLKIRDE
jgi:hypothetical protein